MSVVDNNVLSALAKAERLDLLPAVFEDVYTVPGVVEELDAVRDDHYDFVDRIDDARAAWLTVLTPTTQERRRAEEIHDGTLTFVDAACLAVSGRRNTVLVTDDGHVIEMARQQEVQVMDLLTLLQAAIRRSYLVDVGELEAFLATLENRDSYRFSSSDERVLFDEFE